MFSQGLSLEQAPPISVPFRFFLSAPFFGILIALVFFFFPFNQTSNQYSNEAIGLVHLFTLGILSMIIFGAMQQMMPVLAGATIPKPIIFANLVHLSLFFGTFFMSASFIFGIKVLLHIAIFLLFISFFTFFYICIKLLFKVEFLTSTVKAMRLFSLAGLITLLLGLYLVISHINSNLGENHLNFVNIHILVAFFGFTILLIMGISFQVIPMFYVALDFPKFIQEKVPLITFILLIIFAIFIYFENSFIMFKILFTGIFILFSSFALYSLLNRKRAVSDVTLWYWKLSLSIFIISLVIWCFNIFETNFILAILFSLGFLYSLLQGMVYKIIPFLSWFHLSSKGYFQIPTLREFIDEKYIKAHFFVHLFSLVFFCFSYFINNLIYLAALSFLLSNLFFFYNCIVAVKKYKEVLKKDPMDFTSFV